MPRVVGIDPGTVSFDLCGLEDGHPSFADSLPTSDVADDPGRLARAARRRGAPDAVVGPSGYGLPLRRLEELGEGDLRLAFLSRPGGTEGIRGLVEAVDGLRTLDCPVWLVPGVVHLPTVPEHRKVNRVDMGTADKLCAAAAGMADQAGRLGRPVDRTDFLLVELGGAFTSVLAVRGGAVVDGAGGSSGPPGVRAPGCLDAEVAVLLGRVTKRHVFSGGALSVAEGRRSVRPRGDTPGGPGGSGAAPGATPAGHQGRRSRSGPDLAAWSTSDGPAGVAWRHLMEGVEKACRSLLAVHGAPTEILLSGRHASEPAVLDELRGRLGPVAPVRRPGGDAGDAGTAARGAALLADGLAGGRHAGLVACLRLREASGTVFDHLYVEGASEGAARWLEGERP